MNSLQQSEQIDKISAALVKAQSEMVSPKKESKNPFFGNKYADLSTCWDACKEQLAGNGLSVMQGFLPLTDGSVLVTRLLHESGQWMESHITMSFIMPAVPEKFDKSGRAVPAQAERRMTSQEVGATITYFRRFTLCALLGLCPEDDDGNVSSRSKHQEAAPAIIDANKAMYLEQKFSECDPVYIKEMNEYIKNTLKASSIRFIKEEHFEDVKQGVETAAQVNKKNMQAALSAARQMNPVS
jgi:hypothetical protein